MEFQGILQNFHKSLALSSRALDAACKHPPLQSPLSPAEAFWALLRFPQHAWREPHRDLNTISGGLCGILSIP